MMLLPRSRIERHLALLGVVLMSGSFASWFSPAGLVFLTYAQVLFLFLFPLGLGFIFSLLVVDRWRRKAGLPY